MNHPEYFDSHYEFRDAISCMEDGTPYVVKIHDKLSVIAFLASDQQTLICNMADVIAYHKNCKIISHTMSYQQHQTKWYMSILCENLKPDKREKLSHEDLTR